MTGASKILTVSYGTFSCTLEGFDDPFNTMKAIAEYFRDLAAGDRYFGAEPPVPDAAMLHQIAEREIHRRVEAKIQDNGVILRAADAGMPAEPALVPAPTVSEVNSETVASRLQRIRAKHTASAAIAAPIAAEPIDAAFDAYIEDQHAETEDDLIANVGAAVAPIEIPDQIEDILDEAENDLAMIDISDQFGDLEEVDDLAVTAGEPAFVEPTHDIDPIVEAEPIEAAFETSDDAILANLGRVLPEEVSAPAFAEADEPDDYSDDLNLAELLAEDPKPMAAETVVAEPEVFASQDEPLDALTVDLPEDSADEMDGEDDLLEEYQPVAAPVAQIEDFDQSDAALAAEVAAQPAPEAEIALPEDVAVAAPRARARVIRIRRADAAISAVADTEQPAQPAQPVEKSALSDEAEAALQAELAQLEAELGGTFVEEPAQVSAPISSQIAPSSVEDDVLALLGKSDAALAPVARRSIANTDEASAVNRLMEQAKSEMGDEETRRRQSAIAHLKAAVAATEADRRVTGAAGPKADERLEPYRNDLDRVVRPRRPVSSAAVQAAAPELPAPSAPTPLVLVSAQRIDRAPEPVEDVAARPVMPVRPRRIAAVAAPLAPAIETAPAVMQEPDQADLDEDDILAPGETDNVFTDATSFQDFADQLGASALPDLLEAAAVYCAEVLQRPEFSRPLVMRQISTLAGQSGTEREDYLRGFGTLLRQGRIAKVKRGMFAMTDRSPYLAEARKIAG